ncbi:hypothetical protein [Paraclostridium bifermentans]|uniref:hypothetical protein n=1 Tax=Paraclostridium bifermentans TaxID=1490 RepID=UPI00241C9817|nr:hypothetical protein [Paraclostridium bifermentans]
MKYKKNEKLVITIACSLTVVVVLGFTLMGGSFKSKEEHYVSRVSSSKSQIIISKDDYEIIKEEEKDGVNTFIILEKKNFNKEEMGQLSKNIIKDMNKNFNIYIFDDKEKAQDFNYEKEKTQTLIKAVDQQQIEIKTFYTIKEEPESVPQYYAVESIKDVDGQTQISLSLESIKEPEKALSQMKFLGQTIKDLNKDKKIENLEIKAFSKNEQAPNWEYTSENKSLIIQNELVEI